MSRFMTGLLLGVGVGLLIAPEKGSETRDSIAETAGNIKDKFNKMVGKAGAQLDDLKNLLQNEVEGLSDDMRRRINSILDEAGSKYSDVGNGSYKSEFRPI